MTYALLILTTTIYAGLLEILRADYRRTYAPRWTWATVVVGCGLVLGFAGLALAWWPLPPADPATTAWAVWWLVVWHFVAGGAPIILWQLITDARDADRALRHAQDALAARAEQE